MKRIPAVLVILLSVFASVAHSQINNKKANPFRRFVKALPAVDKVEIISVSPFVTEEVASVDCARPGLICAPDTFPYEIGAVKTLLGEDAHKFSGLWRQLERDHPDYEDQCLPSDHVLRFYQNDKLLLESQICTLCRKMTLPALGVVSVRGGLRPPYFPYDSFQNQVIPDSFFDEGFENLSRDLLPKVGQPLTVFGVLLLTAKGGPAVSYGEGEIYLNDFFAPTYNPNHHRCHTAIKVTGTLQHYPGPPTQQGPVRNQFLPERFYFARPTIQVLRVENPRRPKQGRRR